MPQMKPMVTICEGNVNKIKRNHIGPKRCKNIQCTYEHLEPEPPAQLSDQFVRGTFRDHIDGPEDKDYRYEVEGELKEQFSLLASGHVQLFPL